MPRTRLFHAIVVIGLSLAEGACGPPSQGSAPTPPTLGVKSDGCTTLEADAGVVPAECLDGGWHTTK